MNIQCPNCNHEGHINDFFKWGADGNGHPTVDTMTCPSCLCSNHPYNGDLPMRDEKGRFVSYPKRVELDDFIEIEH